MEIEDEVDLISAFYTCNEINQATLHVSITIDETTNSQL